MDLYHYGMPHRSGRYPWGSGKDPYQGEGYISRKQLKRALVKSKDRTEYERDHKIAPGTQFYRTSTNPNETMKGATYVTYLAPERDLYRGGYIRYRDKKTPYEYTMTSKKELNVAGRETIKKALQTSLEKKPDLIKESVNGYLNILYPKGSPRRYYYIECDENGNYDKTAWHKYVEANVKLQKNLTIEEGYGKMAASLGLAPNLKAAVIKELKKEGFNAMTDDASVGGKGIQMNKEGIDPLIVFDGASVFENISNKEVTTRDEYKATKDYTMWKNKTNIVKSRTNW